MRSVGLACARFARIVGVSGLVLGSAAMAAEVSPDRDVDTLPVAIELGAARSFNGFFLDSFSADSSSVEGRLAAGGDVVINDYSIAEQLQSTAGGAS